MKLTFLKKKPSAPAVVSSSDRMLNDPDYIDNNMLFGMFHGKYLGLSLNNQKTNRSANVLVIGGTGTGKTFKYIKPNLLQENCSMVVTDPSGDIFHSFAPYLISRGYNVYLFNASDFTMSNHYNPLLNCYDTQGNISEMQVDILVNLYMKNAKNSQEGGKSSQDPFWDGAEKAFMTALIYYCLEEDIELLKGGFDADGTQCPAYPAGVCFNTILRLSQEAKVAEEGSGEESPLAIRMNNFFKRKPKNKTAEYWETFATCKSEKTTSTIVLCTAIDLQIFATHDVDMVTRLDEKHPAMNINIDKMATQQSYLFLGIPQSHQAYNFLIAMLYSQLYGRLYELGERKLRNKWHIGYRVGTPVFDYFESEEEAREFYETVSEDDIIESDYVNGTKVYDIFFNNRSLKTSFIRSPLVTMIKNIDKMFIWNSDEANSAPALPIHINFLLDEFKNIGEIPNFLTILSTSRKYRIGSHVVIQNIGQIETMYKEGEHKTLLANVDTTIFLGSIDKNDKEEIQKMLGKTTIRQRSTNSKDNTVNFAPTEVDLMSIDEIGAINQGGRDDEIVIIRDTTPYLCRKLNLTEHRRWKYVQALKKVPKDSPDYVDLERLYRNNGSEISAM